MISDANSLRATIRIVKKKILVIIYNFISYL